MTRLYLLKSWTSHVDMLGVQCRLSSSHHISLPPHLIATIPKDAVKKSFTCSGGPGGQHVNKVATKAEIRFRLDEDWVPEELRPVVQKKYAYRLNKASEVVITSSKSRSPTENLEDCFEKLNDMLRACAVDLLLEERRQPNAEEEELLNQRREKAASMRLAEKKRRSIAKALRSKNFMD